MVFCAKEKGVNKKMKKLMMTLAVLASAFAVNAASVSWIVDLEADGNEYDGWNYAFVQGASGAALAALLDDGKTADFTSELEKLNYVGGTFAEEEYGAASGFINGVTSSDSGYMFIWEGLEKDNAYMYSAADAFEGKTYEAPNPPTSYSVFDSSSEWTNGTVGAAPEPTSGLLLLIGVAGLALRRRRA